MKFSLSSAALVAFVGVISAACAAPTDDAPDADDEATAESAVNACAEEGRGVSDPDDCHPRVRANVRGAYFRKVTSRASAAHSGIRGEGTLPQITIDRSRWLSTPAELRGADAAPHAVFTFGPLDAPSVYMGGHAGNQEVDCGLSWNRVFLRDGRGTWTDNLSSGSDGGNPARRFVVEPNGKVVDGLGNVRARGLDGLVENFAFRPYWRVQAWANPSLRSAENRYFYPGTPFRMNVRAISRNTVQMRIDSGVTDTAPFITTFNAPGFGVGLAQSFKRVNSVDQFRILNGKRDGLEGSNVLPTQTRVTDAKWKNVSLLGNGGVQRCKLACGAQSVTGLDIAGNYDQIFSLDDQSSDGGETIDIHP
jgi:hypothetical protein